MTSKKSFIEMKVEGREGTTIQNVHQAVYFSSPPSGSVPPLPALIVGREEAMSDLKMRLGVAKEGHIPAPVQIITAVRGWPGVGKTTVAAALAHDPDVVTTFPDGILWISLGLSPDLLSGLITWRRALGADELLHIKSL